MGNNTKFSKKSLIVPLTILLIILGIYFFGNLELIQNDDSSTTLNIFKNQFDIKSSSLFLAAFFIGLIDGFNPCAMWVLIYLITLVANLQDKKKLWFIVGTFLLASGILYFIILSLWLSGWEIMSYLGFSEIILLLVGIFAIFTGLYALYDFFKKGGKIVCEVGSIKTRKKTRSRIQEIVRAPITLFSVLAIITLAFAINIVEFICSAGLPAIFTQVLSVANISTFQQYFYILIYTIAFMLDDLIIFTCALFAFENVDLEKYSGFSHLIGGIIMVAIGIMLIFFPQLLI